MSTDIDNDSANKFHEGDDGSDDGDNDSANKSHEGDDVRDDNHVCHTKRILRGSAKRVYCELAKWQIANELQNALISVLGGSNYETGEIVYIVQFRKDAVFLGSFSIIYGGKHDDIPILQICKARGGFRVAWSSIFRVIVPEISEEQLKLAEKNERKRTRFGPVINITKNCFWILCYFVGLFVFLALCVGIASVVVNAVFIQQTK
jgi:hypothetical protein